MNCLDNQDVEWGFEPLFSRLEIENIWYEFHLLKPQNVYHYTSLDAFKSIMENREFWATNIYCMNDSTEYIEGLNRFKKHLEQKLSTVSDAQKKIIRLAISHIDDDTSGQIIRLSRNNIFALCFSYNKDSLELWNYYGGESGISIEFDWNACHNLPGMSLIRKELYDILEKPYKNKNEILPKNNLYFFPKAVVYDENEKNEIIDCVITRSLEAYEKRSSLPINISLAATDLVDQFFLICPYLKHQGFKGEGECRIVWNSVPSESEPFCIYQREKDEMDIKYLKYKIVDLNCRPIQKWPIKEITIGPGKKQRDVEEQVKDFLSENNLKDLIAKVRLSEIPLRF